MRWLFALLVSSIAVPVLADIAVRARLLYTMDGEPIPNAVVLVRDGKIQRVGGESTRIPDGYRILDAEIVTPGFIDIRTIVGLSGIYNVGADQDHDEESGANQAALRAIDGYNPQEELVAYVNRFGVTTMQVGPGRANVVGGQAAIVKTYGATLAEVLVRAPSAMVFNLGEAPKATYAAKAKEPTTRMATAAIVREALTSAKGYGAARSKAGRDKKPHKRELDKEAMWLVVSGELPAMISADRADDIMTAMRIAREFELTLWLDNATEGYLVSKEIRAANVPVIVHPTMQRPNSLEKLNTSLENAALLVGAGVSVALQTGTESYVPKTRILLFEAGMAHANGLPMQDALAAITINPARILKVDRQVGSIEKGKDADLVLFDDNPFEYTSHVLAVITGGAVSYMRERL